MKLLLQGGRLLDPSQQTDRQCDVLIENGKIAACDVNLKAHGAHVISLEGAWITPGFVDLRSVLKDSRDADAALRGGYTTVVASPESALKSHPVLQVLHAAPLTSGLDGEHLGEVPDDAVCVSQGFRPLRQASVLRRALQYASAHGRLLMVHAEDPSLVGAGVLGEGATATRLGLPGVPVAAETAVVARDLILLEDTGGRLHFSHLTTARSVELLRAARARGLAVSADVTPHHLVRDDRTATEYSLEARVWPPLHSEADVHALQEGLRDGTIDAVACDHLRVDALEREHPFELCTPGCESFEHALPTVLRLGLPPLRAVEVLSTKPASLLGLSKSLAVGSLAEITVVHPEQRSVLGVVLGHQHTFRMGVTS